MKKDTEELLLAMQKIRRVMREFTFSIIQDSELTLPQLTVVAVIEEYGELPVSRISELAGLAKSTISGIIDRLENKGLVKRNRPGNDRRTVFVSLVPGSEEHYYEYKRRRDTFLYDRLKDIETERIRQITENLKILGEALQDKDK